MPLAQRVLSFAVAVVLIAYGVSGFLRDELKLSTSKGGGGLLVFYDGAAWLLASAVIVGAILLLSVVVDHYDRRNNERAYRVFRSGALYVGLFLLGAAFLSYLYAGIVG